LVIKYIDTHCHIADKKYEGKREHIVEECRKREVLFFVVGLDHFSNFFSFEFSRIHKLPCFLGLHPLYVESIEQIEKTIEEIKNVVDKIDGIGEIGLDMYRTKDMRNINLQKICFEKFLKLASAHNLPIIIHSRKAEKTIFEYIKKENIESAIILHSYTGNLSLAKEFLKLRCDGKKIYFSIPAIIVRSNHYKKLVKILPLETILCETDAPYQSPIRGKLNYPWHVIYAYRVISEIKEMSIEDLSNIISQNVKEILKSRYYHYSQSWSENQVINSYFPKHYVKR